MPAALNELAAHISDRLPNSVTSTSIAYGELTLDVGRDKIVEVLTLLRDDPACKFEVLIDICGVDYPERRERFDVVYHLLSPRLNQRVRVKITTDETRLLRVSTTCSRRPTGMSARHTTFTAFASPDIRTFGAS